MSCRKESDSLGEVDVPEEKYYGAQTQRSLHNFSIGWEKMPLDVVRAFAWVKKASARANADCQVLSSEKAEWIESVCSEILSGQLDDHFPLAVWQTGSGTQTNMNVNEVISNRVIDKQGGQLGSKTPLHPNDDVNKSQSSNDTFPTAMHIAAAQLVHDQLLSEIHQLQQSFQNKSNAFSDIIKIGRTHLMDATPLTLGQEFSAYAQQIKEGEECIRSALPRLFELALGGTAVGTGINAPKDFADKAIAYIAQWTKLPFTPMVNRFQGLASHDAIVEVSGALKRLACSLMKIANDIRFLASGPRCGIGEIRLPANEPGSSIMPGKVNPTQCEAMAMIAAQIMGNDVTVSISGSLGHFQLNTFKPVMIYNTLQSIHLLIDGVRAFRTKCVDGIEANQQVIHHYLNRSLMLATILNTEMGYDQAAKIVKKAYCEDLSLKEAACTLNLLTEEQFDQLVDPKKMI